MSSLFIELYGISIMTINNRKLHRTALFPIDVDISAHKNIFRALPLTSFATITAFIRVLKAGIPSAS